MKIEKADRHGDRSIETLFAYPDAAVENSRGDTVTPQLSVYTYHDRERKRYVSRIDRNTVSTNIVRTVITYGNDAFPEVINRRVYEPVARYSQKNLTAFHAYMIEYVESLHPDDLEALHAWAEAGVNDPAMVN